MENLVYPGCLVFFSLQYTSHKYARTKSLIITFLIGTNTHLLIQIMENTVVIFWLNFHLWQVWLYFGFCVHLFDTDVIAFKITQDHHKITDNTIITLCHHEGSQRFFPPDTREQQLSVFYTPLLIVFHSSTAPGPLFQSSRGYIYSFLCTFFPLPPTLSISTLTLESSLKQWIDQITS